jgi:hypothetical protein
MKSFQIYIRVFCAIAFGLWGAIGFGQTTLYTQGFETDLTGYSHTPSQTPSVDPTDRYFHRAEPSDTDIYEGSDGPYTNVTGSWMFVGSNPNTINSGSPGILTLGSGINVSGFTNLELSIDFGAVPNDWDDGDNLSVEYSWNNSVWNTLYSFNSGATNSPLDLNGNATGGTNTANGTTLTYALQPVISTNFTGSGTTLYLRVVCDSDANYEAFGLDNIELTGLSAGPTITLSETNISGLSYEDGTGGPSAEQTFEVSGTNLTDDITLTAPTNFEISTTSGSGFVSSLTLPESSGVVNSTTIYVRLIPGLTVNNYSGTLTAMSTGATQQDVSLSGSVFIPIFEDFNDSDFTANPVWTGNTTDFSVITDTTIPDGNATTDGSFLASNASEGDISLAVESTENKEWRFSLATPDFDPSGGNYFGVVLMASNSFSGVLEDADFDGYYLRIGTNGGTDFIELWEKSGTGESKIGDFPSSPDFDPEALSDGLDIRVTRSNTGEFELFYNTGFEYSTTPVTSAGTLTDNTYSTSSYFGVYQNIGNLSNTRRVYLDNIELGNPNIDDDSTVILPSSVQIPSSTIQADLTTLVSDSEPVFSFNVSDSGTSDGVATQITRLKFVPGASNTALWSQVIQGIRIERNSFGTPLGQGNQTVTISDTEILVDIVGSPTQMTVADGVSEEYTISVFLNTSEITDQQVLQFEIESVSTGWDALSTGSQFQDTFTNVIGNTHTIDVVGSNYEFITQPVTSLVNQPMGLNVEVAYTDINGNVDISFSGTVDLTSTGTLSTAIPSQSTVNGVATFPAADIVHTVLGTSFVLEATSGTAGFPSPLTSNTFDIISTPELFITEVSDPDISGGAEKFVEIYNAGVNSIDLSTINYFLTREANAGANYESNQLTGIIEAKGYYILSQLNPTDFNTAYGISSDIQGSLLGNGNDSYYLSTSASVSDSNVAISTLFDIYGEVGINGFTNDSSTASSNAVDTDDAPWEYADSRAYRLNPDVKNANSTWTSTEWFVDTDGALVSEMTPGYGDNDYIYENGDWNNNIYLNANPNGVNEPNRNIFIKSGTVTFDSNTEIGDLVVRSGATLELEPGVKLTVNGDIVNEGTIIFESDDTSTAVLEAVQPSTRVVGDGFEVHRRIPVQPGIRAFRYLSSSVDTQNSLFPYVYDNWQEGGGTPSGFGTHITGAVGPVGSISPEGFDYTSSGNASMYSYDPNLSQPWQSISNTNATTFSIGDAYAILIRGDRSSSLNTNDQTGPSTTIKTTGQIHVGDFPVPNLSTTDGHFNLVGNPYQSQVDLEALLGSATNINQNIAYIWDPTLGSLGGYAVIDFSLLPNVNTQIDFGATTPNTSDANQYLQPQQAFFVETDGVNPQITFTENVKDNNTNQTAVFEEEPLNFYVLDISLQGNNNKTYDGVRLVYDNDYSNSIDNLDAAKFWNYTDNMSIISNSSYLSVEKRNIPSENEKTPLLLDGLTLSSYTFEGYFYTENTDFDIYLHDNYTGENIDILPNTSFSYTFSIDPNIPETNSSDRFELVYGHSTLGIQNNDLNALTLFPNPLSKGESLVLQNISTTQIEQIEILNLNGQLLEVITPDTIYYSGNSAEILIKTTLNAGTYILKVISGKTTNTFKIIYE